MKMVKSVDVRVALALAVGSVLSRLERPATSVACACVLSLSAV